MKKLLFVIVLILIDGLAAMKIWNWFIMPLGMAQVTLPQGIGISLFFSVVTHQSETDMSEESQKVRMLWGLINPLICLLLGWLTHLFM